MKLSLRARVAPPGGTLLALLAAACSGTAPVMAKYGYADGLAPEQILAIRFILAAPLMLLLAVVTGQSPAALPPRRALALLTLGAVGFSGQALSFFWALHFLPASLTELLVFTFPAVVAVESWAFTSERVSLRHLAIVGVSVIGVLLLVGVNLHASLAGVVLALTCTLLYATYFMLGERAMRGTPPLAAVALVMLGAAVSLGLAAAAEGNLQFGVGARSWMVLGGITAVPTLLGITLLLVALPMIGALRASVLGVMEPVVTVALSTVLLGETLSGLQLLGGALILGAAVALQRQRATVAAELPPP